MLLLAKSEYFIHSDLGIISYSSRFSDSAPVIQSGLWDYCRL